MMDIKEIVRAIDFADQVMQKNFKLYAKETHKALMEAIKLIEEEPKTVPPMPKAKWIPADKLPPFVGNHKISDDVLITNGYDVYMGYLVERKGKIFWHYYESNYESNIEDEENDAIAWMPLPEPPKEIEWAEMTREESEG